LVKSTPGSVDEDVDDELADDVEAAAVVDLETA
jgi:hypothetical protein